MVNGNEVELHEVLTVDAIPLRAATVPSALELERMQHLQGVELYELQNKSVGLLIGLDNPALFRPLESRHGRNGEPDAILTTLDWTLFGTASSGLQGSDHCFHVCTLTDHALAASTYQSAFSCGLECDNSKEDRIALEQMEQSVQLIDGHFQMPLLRCDKQTVLPDNRAVAYLRTTDENGQVVHCLFVMGKSHLAPNPRTTIPRLELLAAVTAVRLRWFLAEQLPLSLEATYL